MADQSPNKSAGIPVGNFQDPLLQINFDDPQKKKDKEYGRTLLARIFKEQNNQSSSFYFGGRNIRWMENWQWAMGRQNMNEFTDYVSTEGNKAYAPVDMTQNRIGPQFLGVLVDSMSQNEEYPCVSAVDDGSRGEKLQRKLDALFRMREIETISDLQQQAGVQLEPTNAYVPDDELSAEVYFILEDKLPKEIRFEELLEKTINDNQFKQKARQTKRDLIVLNCGCTKVERNEDGFISIRKVTPANLIYNFFMSDSGQMELSYIGEVYSLKVKDIRNKWGKCDTRPDGLTEKQIFDMAATANQFNNANRFIYYWNESYLYATDRPYDDYGVQVFDCEIQSFDADYYVSKQDSFGKESIKQKNGIPQPTSEKSKIIKKDKLIWYRGIWAVKSDQMIYWGLPDLVIKPFMDISKSMSSYSIQMPNNDGDYVPSLFERGLSPLRKWTLSDLKIKQIIGTIAPPGISIDIETIRDIDLGNGNTISPMEVIKIRNQTGNVIWSSKGLDPTRQQDIPIKELSNSASFAQLTELVNVKNDSMQEIRSVWGVPLYRDGSDLPPRMGAAVVENQTTNSNNVTDFINFADKCLWEETLHKCCLLHWDDVVLRKGENDLMGTEFEVTIELKPTALEREKLARKIDLAMKTIDPTTGKPLISFKDAFRIENIKNYKLADMYLANTEEKNMRQAAVQKKSDIEANAKLQQESNDQAATKAIQLQKDKLEQEKDLQDFVSTKKKEELLLQGFLAAAAKDETGGLIKLFLPAIQQLVPNITMPLAMENKQIIQVAQSDVIQDKSAEQNPQEEQVEQPMMQ